MNHSLSSMLTGIADTATVIFYPSQPDERYNLTTIPTQFKQFEQMQSVRIGNIVTTIGSDAFYFCDTMTSVTISNRVMNIDSGSFAYCTSLTSVTIPPSVTSIGNYVFQGCFDLSTMNCYVTRTTVDAGTNVLQGTAFPFTINARASDATWTAGPDTVAGQTVTVVKNL